MDKMIDGVTVTPLKMIKGERGNIMHALKRSDPEFMSFGEAYFSTVTFGDVKGWKKHRKMVLNLVVVEGKVKFVVFDDRRDSSTKGAYFQVTLSPMEYYARLTVQPGLWLAFEGLGNEQNILLNIASIEHDPTEAELSAISSGDITYPGVV
jgi:dTDP-4-dehydrorhamnose 3,5-epimerase